MPLYIFLILYCIFLVVFIIGSAIALYHALKFGFKGDATRIMSIIFAIVTSIIILVSLVYIGKIDWSVEWNILDLF